MMTMQRNVYRSVRQGLVLAAICVATTGLPVMAQEAPTEYGQGPGVKHATTLPRTGNGHGSTNDAYNGGVTIFVVALTFGAGGFALGMWSRRRV